jgi:predicted RNase H-like HicB family nuclease
VSARREYDGVRFAQGGTMKLTAVFKKVRGGYIGFVEELLGANTQGRTLRETRSNLKEAVALVRAANRTLAREREHTIID